MKKICFAGFSLIEFMVYLIAFSCIITVALHALVGITQKARSNSLNVHKTMQLFTALDCMAFELAQAPAAKNKWYKTENQECIWHSNLHKKDISYCCVDKKLVRIRGVYSMQKNSWLSKVSTTIVDALDSCLFDYEWSALPLSNRLKSVQCDLVTKSCSTKRKICLNNGYIYE